MKDFQDRVVAVTGAASGIGRALAVECAARGAHLALSDIDEDGLAETVDRVAAHGVQVDSWVVDVADRGAVEDWADDVVESFGRVNVIVNNAGVSVTCSIEELSYEDFEWLMSINFWGVVHGTKAFLPHLRASGEGHVVNMSSIFGVIAQPSQAAYNAAKFAVRGFTESLRAELELTEAPVSATSVHPGGVKTNIVRSSRVDETGPINRSRDDLIAEFDEEFARISPDEAARQILKAVCRDKRRVMVGNDAKALDILQRLMPSGYIGGLVRVMRRRYFDG